jgi:hypothetical protein
MLLDQIRSLIPQILKAAQRQLGWREGCPATRIAHLHLVHLQAVRYGGPVPFGYKGGPFLDCSEGPVKLG